MYRLSTACVPLVFFNDTATTEIYTLSLHDALPISHINRRGFFDALELATVPPMVSHTGVIGVHAHWRNIDDEQLRAVADKGGDRKSTRLNSSHANISYAVFCLKKKNRLQPAYQRTE